MPLDASYRLQSNSGTVDPAATSFTATLPNPTTDGSTLMLWFASNGAAVNLPVADPPWCQDAVKAGSLYVWRRPNQPAALADASPRRRWSGLSPPAARG